MKQGTNPASLVPRPRPAFHCFQYRKATESWAGPGNEAKPYSIWKQPAASIIQLECNQPIAIDHVLPSCMIVMDAEWQEHAWQDTWVATLAAKIMCVFKVFFEQLANEPLEVSE